MWVLAFTQSLLLLLASTSSSDAAMVGAAENGAESPKVRALRQGRRLGKNENHKKAVRREDEGYKSEEQNTVTATTTTAGAPFKASSAKAEPVTVISFVAMGDIPYDGNDRYCLNGQLRDIDLTSPGSPFFLVHIGDIKRGSAPCDDEAYSDVAEIFTHPDNSAMYDPRDAFFVPGDNEWTDCKGDFPYANAWSRWMAHFGPGNPYGFGTLSDGTTVVDRQSDVYRLTGVDRGENFAFLKGGVLFVGVNAVGGGTIGDESTRLTQNFDWIQCKLAEYRSDVRAVVVFGHAGLDGVRKKKFGKPLKRLLRKGYPGLPAMYLHGDTHTFHVKRPDRRNSNLIDVEVEDGDKAPPLIVSVLRNATDDTYSFAIDQQGGLYDAACPRVRNVTWYTLDRQ